jgi:hypothetical protein
MNPTFYVAFCAKKLMQTLQATFWLSKASEIAHPEVILYEKDYKKEFSMSKAMLVQCGWNQSEYGNISFDSVTFDFLMQVNVQHEDVQHTTPLTLDTIPSNFSLIEKLRTDVSQNYQWLPISYSQETHRRFAVFEIVMFPCYAPQQLFTLERNLTILLCRERVEMNDPHLRIEQVVCAAGIVSTEQVHLQLLEEIERQEHRIPMVSALCQYSRFYVGTISLSQVIHSNAAKSSLATKAVYEEFNLENEIRAGVERQIHNGA